MDTILVQGLTGLSSAATLFLTAAGLTIVFGVSRVVNFAHGSLFMLGAYSGWTFLSYLPSGPLWFVVGVLGAGCLSGLVAAVIERLVIRPLYGSTELFQLLATYGVVLILRETTLLLWGPNDYSLPRAAWLGGSIPVFGERMPAYDVGLIVVSPLVLLLLVLLFHRTRFGMLIRACTEDRSMAAALGINQTFISALVFTLGGFLAGIAGALMLPDRSANLQLDLSIIVEAFVVVVLGGMGSLGGAFIASVIIGELQAFGALYFPESTLIVVFAAMVAVLIFRPFGLLGSATLFQDRRMPVRARTLPRGVWIAGASIVLMLAVAAPWLTASWMLLIEELLANVLFAVSLFLLLGTAGIVSFGHAAWFASGAYVSALAFKVASAPVAVAIGAGALVAGLIAAAFAVFVVRLSGIYLAMLTLAVAQIAWAAATQWTWLTGGDDGILSLWPRSPLVFFWTTLALSSVSLWVFWRVERSGYGLALTAARDNEARALSVGLSPRSLRAVAFALSASGAGLAGGLSAFTIGSVFPSYAAVEQSVDGLVMVLLGGLRNVLEPAIGALAYTGLYDLLSPTIAHWRLVLGVLIVAMVRFFPNGLLGIRCQPR
jgi:branched-chain amino acid transport system permease protein